MALVYKCDRCGKVVDNAVDGGGNGPFVWDGTLSKDQEHMDLCEECYNDLVSWLNMDKPKGTNKNDKHCDNCKFASYAEHMYPCNCCSHILPSSVKVPYFVDRWIEKKDN